MKAIPINRNVKQNLRLAKEDAHKAKFNQRLLQRALTRVQRLMKRHPK